MPHSHEEQHGKLQDTSSLEPVTGLSRILQPVEQHRSEKRSVLWHLPCMHEYVEVVLGTP